MKKNSICLAVVLSLLASYSSAQVVVENEQSIAIGTVPGGGTVQQDTYILADFDMGAGDKLLVAVGNEAGTAASFGVTFNGAAMTQVEFSTDASGSERSHLYLMDGASGMGDVVVTLSMPGEVQANGPGIYAVSLSGANPGIETSGNFGDGENVFGDLTGVLTGVASGSYALAVFTDQGNPGDVEVTGDLMEVGTFNGPNGNENGSGTVAAASGFGTGADLSVTFSDNSSNDTAFQNRSNFAYVTVSSAGGVGGFVVPAAYDPFRGIELSGAITDFADSDDTRAMYNPGFTIGAFEAPVWLIFDAVAAGATDFSVESQAGTPGLTYTFEAFDWAAGVFVVVGDQAELFGADQVVTFPIGPENIDVGGEVRSRVGWRATGFTINFPWEVRVDQVGWIQ